MPRAATHAARAGGAAKRPARRSRSEAGPARATRRTARTAASARAAQTARTAHTARTARPGRTGTARAARPARFAQTSRAPSTVPRRAPGRAPRRAAGAVVLRLPVRSASGLVDRLLRGRLWVVCVGALLAGIVFLNVSLLGINGGIAATSDQAAELRRQNAELRLEVSRLASAERIQRVAEAEGFAMPAPGEVTYLEADPEHDGARAAAALEQAAASESTAPEAASTAPE